ncbi:uncharacterized protein LOC126801904 isoform X2 [Argentina anserina]|uniref:uncharacterized protein LOC126801904 isoform X2 n=1 Tax=Argentina anserina TaxID=57926 RepID=UPI00217629FD|nr:uncharacterized protein LOC126801904 isoform X2 [Potentilla anserina]
MAKKSQRRSVRYEKDQLGCMWGLINIFDFRHGRPNWKMISDKRHGSKQAIDTGSPRNKFEVLSGLDEDHQGTFESNGETTATAASDACKPSVKKLIEEEMSSEQDMKKEINTDEVASNQTDASRSMKDQKRTKKTRKKSRDMDTYNLIGSETLEPVCSCNQKQDHKSKTNRGVDEIIEEVCCQIHQKYTSVTHDLNGEAPVKSNYKHSDLEEKLCMTIKEFMNQKFTDGKNLTEDQKIQHFRELMDALETLSSDEELFMKLLQDPNSLLAKYVLNLQDSQREKDQESKAVKESNTTEKLEDSKLREELVIRKQRYFFGKKSKPQEKEPAEANENLEASKRIVILKPGPTVLRESETESNKITESHYIVRSKGPNAKVGSHFFLSEMKRKLKNAMGKQQHGVSTIGNSNKLPEHQSLADSDKGSVKDKFGSSPSKDHFYMERIAKPSGVIKRADKSGKTKESEMNLRNEDQGIADQRVSNIYIEAKKHLSEMLSNGDAVIDFSGQHFPKTLGRILSLPEYNVSPRGSPGRDSELGFVTAQMRLSPRDKVWRANENVWSPKQEKNVSPLGQVPQNVENRLSVSDNNPDHKVQPSNFLQSTSVDLINDSETEESHVLIKEEMNPEGDIDITKEIEVIAWEEESIQDAPSEPNGSSTVDQSGNMTEVLDDERCSEWLKQNDYEEIAGQSSALSSPSSSPTIKHVEGLDIVIGTPERPSPVSVLDPLYSEDEISPSKTISQPELPVQPLRIRFEDHGYSAIDEANSGKTCTEDKELTYDFVKEVTQASGFNWEDFCMKWLSSDQLIEPSLCDDLVFCPNSLCYDQRLLFDCINEVLVEVCGRYYGCFPWVSSVKSLRPVPDMKTAIHEVWVEVYWHLLPLPSPHTLDQIVAKDLSRTQAWMDLRFDTETFGTEMGEAILQDLIEDVISSYNGSPIGEDALVSEELHEAEHSQPVI